MGLRSSPYVTIKQMHLGFEMANGNRLDPKNALRWERAVLNLPGDPAYQPLLPWMYRVRSDGELAGSTLCYVDDLRPVGCSGNACWAVLHQIVSRLGYLGIQNASRKTRPPSQAPGAWAGTIASTGQDGVGVKCDQGKWEKAQCYLQALRDELAQEGTLDQKGLESKRGFFIHLQRTYPAITPFLKGIYTSPSMGGGPIGIQKCGNPQNHRKIASGMLTHNHGPLCQMMRTPQHLSKYPCTAPMPGLRISHHVISYSISSRSLPPPDYHKNVPTWTGSCGVCGKIRKQMNELFCANFAHSRDCWRPCNSVWCGSCYTQHPLDHFPRLTPTDESGFEWRPESDLQRYTQARDGDHLLLPFQCDLCVFRNLTCRNPHANSPDDFLLCCIRRVNLDAMWGREPSTV